MQQKYGLKCNKQKNASFFFDAFFLVCGYTFANQGMTTTLTFFTLSFWMTWSV